MSPQVPFVSTKQSSHGIAMDYADADPTLATKTSVRARLSRYHYVKEI